MLRQLKPNLLFVYVILMVIVFTTIPLVMDIQHAGTFTKNYSVLLIGSIAIYGLLFSKKELILLVKQLSLVGIILSVTATVIFFILSEMDRWFLFEKSGNTWLGLGMLITLMYFLIGILLGMLLWGLKLIILKITKWISN